MRSKTKAALLLSMLSPFLAEVLGGSTPPLEVLANPISFPLLWLYYGMGVLLVREAWVRWGRTTLRLMLLGFLYGVIEEGVVIRSWFDPNWPDLGILGVYGRTWGISTVWAVWLTIYHSLMSISIPILIVDALYPELREESFLEGKSIYLAFLGFVFSGIVFALGLTKYMPPISRYLVAVMSAAVLFTMAKRTERELPSFKTPSRHPYVYGLTVAFLLFLTFTALPRTSIPPVLTSMAGILLTLHFYSSLRGENSVRIILGFLAFWLVIFDVLLEINGVIGEAILGPLTYAVLHLKLRRISSRAHTDQPQAGR